MYGRGNCVHLIGHLHSAQLGRLTEKHADRVNRWTGNAAATLGHKSPELDDRAANTPLNMENHNELLSESAGR